MRCTVFWTRSAFFDEVGGLASGSGIRDFVVLSDNLHGDADGTRL
jgi:hypothetical protein